MSYVCKARPSLGLVRAIREHPKGYPNFMAEMPVGTAAWVVVSHGPAVTFLYTREESLALLSNTPQIEAATLYNLITEGWDAL